MQCPSEGPRAVCWMLMAAGLWAAGPACGRMLSSFREDFDKTDPVRPWRTNDGRYTVNFKGLTRENASSGQSAFKLDVTVEEGSYVHWWIPLRAFPAGKLAFSARVLVDGRTNGQVRFGPVYGIVPDFPAYDRLNDLLPVCPAGKGWHPVGCDVAEMGRNLVRMKLPYLAWGVKEENTGSYLEGLCLRLEPPARGKGRFVVYLDAVLVEGETVTEDEFAAAVGKRWEPARVMIKEKLDAWDKTIAEKEARVTDEDMKAKIPHIRRRVITARSCGFIPPAQMEEMAGYFREMDRPAGSSVLPKAESPGVRGPAAPSGPLVYHEDFEGTGDPVKLDSTRGKYTVNFQGITDEKAFSGRQSYKIDVTLETGGAYNLSIPLDDIPVGDNLKFSGMVLVEQCLPRSRCVLGVDFSFRPCLPDAPGWRSFPWNVECRDWTRIYADIPNRASALARKLLPYQCWSAAPPDKREYPAVYLPRIFINIFTRDTGDLNRRFIVYLDDLRIEGEVPDREKFRKDAEKRWETVRTRTNDKLDSWASVMAESGKELAALTGLPGEAAALKAKLEQTIRENDPGKMSAIADARRKGWLPVDVYRTLEPFCRNLKERHIANIKDLARPDMVRRIRDGKPIIYVVDTTITPADWVLPDSALVPGRIGNEIAVTACPGEYEPASFVVSCPIGVKGLRVRAGRLTGRAGAISEDAVDIKVVKCWYQDQPGGRTLTPELLLNDDDLVRVDPAKKLSRVRFKTPGGDKHLCAEDPDYPKLESRGRPIPADYPIRAADDAGRLGPVDIAANENRQFWVTVRVPEDAGPGYYTGRISLSAGGEALGEIALRLKVLPIKLAPLHCQTSVFGSYRDLGAPSIYYQGKLCPSGYAMMEQRYRSELADQVAHGITVPPGGLDDGAGGDFLGPLFHKEMLERTLRIRAEYGGRIDPTLLGATHIIHRGLGITSHKANTNIEVPAGTRRRFLAEFAEYVNILKSHGVREVYFHLADERDGAELAAWLPVFKTVHEAGGKVVTCLQLGNSFELAGGITDLFFCENGINRSESDKWHSKGTKVWPVWDPNGGLEDSDLSRRNHGLLIWRTACDGVTEYLYSLEQGWLDGTSVRGGGGDGVHNLVYRTSSGIIDTIQWEGYREGIDDVRYITTLEERIAAAKKTGRKTEAVAAAEKYLADIDVEYGDLNRIRAGIIEHIIKLGR